MNHQHKWISGKELMKILEFDKFQMRRLPFLAYFDTRVEDVKEWNDGVWKEVSDFDEYESNETYEIERNPQPRSEKEFQESMYKVSEKKNVPEVSPGIVEKILSYLENLSIAKEEKTKKLKSKKL